MQFKLFFFTKKKKSFYLWRDLFLICILEGKGLIFYWYVPVKHRNANNELRNVWTVILKGLMNIQNIFVWCKKEKKSIFEQLLLKALFSILIKRKPNKTKTPKTQILISEGPTKTISWQMQCDVQGIKVVFF